MMHPLLKFDMIEAELRERRQHSEVQRLSRTAARQHYRQHSPVLMVLGSLLIAVGQRLQPRSPSRPVCSREGCVPCA